MEARAKELPPLLETKLQALLEAHKARLVEVAGGPAPSPLVRPDARLWLPKGDLPELAHASFVRVRPCATGGSEVASPALVELEKAYGQFHDGEQAVDLIPSRRDVARACAQFQASLGDWMQVLQELDDFTAARLDAQGADLADLRQALVVAATAAQHVTQEQAGEALSQGRPERAGLVQFISRVRGIYWDYWAEIVHPDAFELEAKVVGLILDLTRSVAFMDKEWKDKEQRRLNNFNKRKYWMDRARPAGRTGLAREALEALMTQAMAASREMDLSGMPPFVEVDCSPGKD